MAYMRTLDDIDVAGKTVLLRVDFNVPFHPGTTEISDDIRIRASLPTVRYLLGQLCKVVLCSHLGRPKGRVVETLRMEPVSRHLATLLGTSVVQTVDCVGGEVRAVIDRLVPGGIVMLENVRFHPGEELNSPEFAGELASLADAYVNDAFGVAHRAHASTDEVTGYLPSVAGFLMARELLVFGAALDNASGPFAAIIGGAKVSDKIAVLRNLVTRVDTLIVGGGLVATFLRSQGLEIGASLVEDELVPAAGEVIRLAKERGLTLLLPEDIVIAESFSASANHRTVEISGIPRGWRIMDIGPRTASVFEEALSSANLVVWNGPMGVSEWGPFAEGTARIARALAALSGATTVIGGGSTAEIVASLGLDKKMTHVSTGGGASLEFLEGRTLPGVAALMNIQRTAVR
jgi:phosphoglycerate kinase